MNTVFAHFGQAGNQIGREFWNWMQKEYFYQQSI